MAKNEKSKESSNQTKTAKKPIKKQHKILRYFKDLKAEFKKVVWPSKKLVLNNTSVVLLTMCASGIFVWAVDIGLSQLLKLVLNKG